MITFQNKKPGIVWLFVSFFLAFFTLSWLLFGYLIKKEGSHEICSMINDKVYVIDQPVQMWLDECFKMSSEISFNESKKQIFKKIQFHFEDFPYSHLGLYSPLEQKKIWKGESKENGFRLTGIDGLLIVSKVLPNSPAEKNNIQLGDVLVSINNRKLLSEMDGLSEKGKYRFQRKKDFFEVELVPEPVIEPLVPTLKTVRKSVLVLKIPSFIESHFMDFDWQSVGNLNGKKLILDLRNNSGGDFKSAVRLLSILFCSKREFGKIVKTRSTKNTEAILNDVQGDNEFIKQLYDYDSIHLNKFSDYPCFKGDLQVLVNTKTASVSEIVVQNLKEQKRAQIFGEVTAGEMLLSIWYQLNVFNSLHISIPEATYVSSLGHMIEGVGVEPDKWLALSKEGLLSGSDEWLEELLH